MHHLRGAFNLLLSDAIHMAREQRQNAIKLLKWSMLSIELFVCCSFIKFTGENGAKSNNTKVIILVSAILMTFWKHSYKICKKNQEKTYPLFIKSTDIFIQFDLYWITTFWKNTLKNPSKCIWRGSPTSSVQLCIHLPPHVWVKCRRLWRKKTSKPNWKIHFGFCSRGAGGGHSLLINTSSRFLS